MTVDTRAQLAAVLVDLATLVESVAPEREHDATPCTEFDVAALRAHVLGWLTTFADGFSDPDGRAPEAPSTVTGDAADVVRTQARRIDDALAAGAADRPLLLGDAGLPGDMALSMVLWEYQAHGWDLAVATGLPWAPDEAGLEASLAFAATMLTADFQGEGKAFAPRVPVDPDAPAIDRLAALSGRDPLWVPDGARPGFLYVGSMRTRPGRRDELVDLLTASVPGTADGCSSYVVAADPEDAELVWVSETWLSARHHATSLRAPASRAAIDRAMPLLTGEFTGRSLDVTYPERSSRRSRESASRAG